MQQAWGKRFIGHKVWREETWVSMAVQYQEMFFQEVAEFFVYGT
jgi:hypothetical protein